MKTIISTGWNFMRMLRLILGIVAIVFAILRQDMLLGAAGGFLLLTALLNTGCCGVNGCAVPTRNQESKAPGKEPGAVSYEEEK